MLAPVLSALSTASSPGSTAFSQVSGELVLPDSGLFSVVWPQPACSASALSTVPKLRTHVRVRYPNISWVFVGEPNIGL